jgi:hypothetical protein
MDDPLDKIDIKSVVREIDRERIDWSRVRERQTLKKRP